MNAQKTGVRYSIEEIYLSALPGKVERQGLTAYEYVNMCVYYETEAFPVEFQLKGL